MQDEKTPPTATPEAAPPPVPEHPSALVPTAVGFGLFLVATLVVMSLTGEPRAPSAHQPVEFNHRLHVEDLELECSECHRFYEEQTFSGFPTATTCAFCHEEAVGESEAEARLVEMIGAGEELVWQPLFRQPPHVFYSHSRHATVAGIDCPTCHGAFAESERPPSRVEKLDMDGCIDCHERENVSTDCTACHR